MTTSTKNKSFPSFTKSAKSLLTATANLDHATAKFAGLVSLNLQQYLDVCSMAGVMRDQKGCAAIGKADERVIEEAGGVITDFQGRAVGPDYRSCIAGSLEVHRELCTLLK